MHIPTNQAPLRRLHLSRRIPLFWRLLTVLGLGLGLLVATAPASQAGAILPARVTISVSGSNAHGPVSDGTTVEPGDVLTYTVDFLGRDNAVDSVNWFLNYNDLADDADLDLSSISVSGPVRVYTPPGKRLQVYGTVGNGTSARVTFQAKVKAGGSGSTNVYAYAAGGWALPSCDPASYHCTANPVHVGSGVDVATTVQRVRSDGTLSAPIDGRVVNPGERLRYTLTFSNNTGASQGVRFTDDYQDLLDDAPLVSFPVVTNPPGSQLGATSAVPNASFEVAGQIGDGVQATVSFDVQVKSVDQLKQDLASYELQNYVIESPSNVYQKPANCHQVAGDDPLCTRNPMALFSWSFEGSQEGTTLVRTITVSNPGTAEFYFAPGEKFDKLVKLDGALDDATLVELPRDQSGNQPVTVDPESCVNGFRFRGLQLGAGDTYTWTYKLELKPGGDGILGDTMGNTGTVTGKQEPGHEEEPIHFDCQLAS